LFEKDGDYQAFERVLAEALHKFPMRLLAFCLMPNHWHLVLWPHDDGDLSTFVQWLTVTHSVRWHTHYHTAGTGHIYQNRFKSFPIEGDDHLYTVIWNSSSKMYPFPRRICTPPADHTQAALRTLRA